MFHYSISCCKL